MRLILVRHGQTQSNIDHLIDTVVPGPPLTELGNDQAEAVSAVLASRQIDAVFASTQLRAQQTAAPIARARGVEVVVRDGLREITAGDYEGRADKESIMAFVDTEFAWVLGDLERRMPGGESGRETLGRFDAVVEEAHGAGYRTVVIVSHGSMIRTWSGSRARNPSIDVDYVRRNALRNTGMIELDGTPDQGWTVLTWLDDSVDGVASDDPGASDGPGESGDPGESGI